MTAFPTVVRGFVTRICTLGDRLYFHVSGDELPYGFTQSDYNFILYESPNFQSSYQLLLKAAEHKWEVVVQRSNSMEKHKHISQKWAHYNVDYVYVDFKADNTLH